MAINNGLQSLSDFFAGDRCFVIPAYQRTYAWDTAQLRDLLDDLKFCSEEGRHFFGTLLLREIGEEKNGMDVVEIVDGQQRLTTTIILINEIIRSQKGITKRKEKQRLEERYICLDDIYKLQVQKQDRQFFEDFVLEKEEYPNMPLTISQRKLKTAMGLFHEHVESMDSSAVKILLQRLQRLQILVYAVETAGDAALMFETTNDRGKPLSAVERTKSFLMYHTQITSKKPHIDLQYINKRFQEIYLSADFLGSNKFYKIDEERVQRYHFILNEDWSDKEDYNNVVEFIRKQVRFLVREKGKAPRTYIRTYSQTLRMVFLASKELIAKAESSKGAVGKALNDIFLLGRPANFLQIIIAGWIKYQTGSCRKRDFLYLLKAIETFSFRSFAIGRRRADVAELQLYALGYNLFQDASSVIETTEKINKLGVEYAPDDDVMEMLAARNFYDRISNSDIKFLLMKYEEYLRTSRQPREDLPLDRKTIFSEKIEIEHIYPRNNKQSEKFNNQYINRLGNLALASKPANGSMGDKPFHRKAKKYYKDSVFRMQRDLTRQKNWNRSTIKTREKKIIKFVMGNWPL